MIRATTGHLVDPRRQKVSFRVLPVAVLRLEGVLAVTAGVAAAAVAVAAVVARIVARAAREVPSRCRPAVLVVLGRRILALRWQLAVPLLTGRCRRVILVQHTMKAHRSVAARDVVDHRENGARRRGLLRVRIPCSTARQTCRSIVFRYRGVFVAVVVIGAGVAATRSIVARGRRRGGARFALLIVARSRGDVGFSFPRSDLVIRRFFAVVVYGRTGSRNGRQGGRDRARRRRRLRRGTLRAVRDGERGERGRGRGHERQRGNAGHDLRCSRSAGARSPTFVLRRRRGLR